MGRDRAWRTLALLAVEWNQRIRGPLLFSWDVLHFQAMDASFWRGLAGAVAIHVAAGGALLLGSPEPWLAARVSAPAPVWIDVEPPLPPPAPAEPLPPPVRQTAPSNAPPGGLTTLSRSSVPPAAGSVGSVLHSGEPSPDGIGVAGDGGPAASFGAADGEGGRSTGTPGPRRRRPIDIGIGPGVHWAMVGPPPASVQPPRPLSPTGGLQEALDAHDRAIGLGFGGPAVSAVHAAASQLSAPRAGLATIEIVFDGLGKVQSTRVLSANNDFAGWSKVAADARAILAAGRIRVPAQSAGLAITLQVESRTQMPSGAAPGSGVPIRPSGLGVAGQFDLSDIGATPTRAVSVRLVGERRL